MPVLNSLNLDGPFILPNEGRYGIVSGGIHRYVYTDVSGNGPASLSLLPAGVQDTCDPDLNTAMSKCRANRGDTITCLPGHVETVTATSHTFVAGVRIRGIGVDAERPKFNWTVAGSTWAINVANVSIENCQLNCAVTAATTTTKAINVTGAGCVLVNNRITLGSVSTIKAAIGIEVGTGADEFIFVGNEVFATADSAVTDAVKIVAAVKKARFLRNIMDVGMGATTKGLISMTVAPVNIVIANNVLSNTITNSTLALVGITAATGYVQDNRLYITNATGGATAFGTPGSLGANENYGCATNGSGLLTPAAGG